MIYGAPLRGYKRTDCVFLKHLYGENGKTGLRVRPIDHISGQKIIGMNVEIAFDPQNVIGGQGQVFVAATGVKTGKFTVTREMERIIRFQPVIFRRWRL
jgi:hypothetical protein